MEYLYRCEELIYASGDFFDEYISLSDYQMTIFCKKHEIIKNTRKGVWIDYYGDKKFVLLSARKRFACPTIEEAIISFKARKERQITILESQLERAREALYTAENENIDISLCS